MATRKVTQAKVVEMADGAKVDTSTGAVLEKGEGMKKKVDWLSPVKGAWGFTCKTARKLGEACMTDTGAQVFSIMNIAWLSFMLFVSLLATVIMFKVSLAKGLIYLLCTLIVGFIAVGGIVHSCGVLSEATANKAAAKHSDPNFERMD